MENYSCLFFSTQPVPIAAFLKDDEKRDWLVEPHCFTFCLTFMIAPMRNAALPIVCGRGRKCGRMREKEAGKKMTKRLEGERAPAPLEEYAKHLDWVLGKRNH